MSMKMFSITLINTYTVHLCKLKPQALNCISTITKKIGQNCKTCKNMLNHFTHLVVQHLTKRLRCWLLLQFVPICSVISKKMKTHSYCVDMGPRRPTGAFM